jgi:hypothetical protein
MAHVGNGRDRLSDDRRQPVELGLELDVVGVGGEEFRDTSALAKGLLGYI